VRRSLRDVAQQWRRDETWEHALGLDHLLGVLDQAHVLAERLGLVTSMDYEASATDGRSIHARESVDEFSRDVAEAGTERLEGCRLRIFGRVPPAGEEFSADEDADFLRRGFSLVVALEASWGAWARTRVSVSGADRTSVEGVFAQLRETVAAQVAAEQAEAEAQRLAKEAEAAQAVQDVRVVEASIASPSPQPWYMNGWVVGIGTGVVSEVVVLLVALLVGQ